jgi:hypothetical protein
MSVPGSEAERLAASKSGPLHAANTGHIVARHELTLSAMKRLMHRSKFHAVRVELEGELSLVRPRQNDLELTEKSGLRLDIYAAAMLFNNDVMGH